ncbi:MAG: 4Fe-4S ferredoxin, partial [Desulfobacterium sp.]|nr:4Fe-4S ferredoxin [Desulfobacterium sp.]MBU4035906.1 4Fe-4S ferredoxin [Pseudomonadota bacterium]
KMVEYAMGVLKNKAGKALFVNFITDISPACDCYPYNDAPIVRDIGIVASNDPVAIDQASADMVNNEQALPGTCMNSALSPGEDKFKAVYPAVDWPIQLDYAQKLGLGSRNYKIIEV